MSMLIYRRRLRPRDYPKVFSKLVETTLRCIGILCLAAIPTIIVVEFWWHVFYLRHVHVDPEMRETLLTAVIPGFFITYSLLASALITKVFDEYKQMRMAVKRADIDSFMLLADEDLSPLLHGMALLLASAVLIGLMMLGFPDFFHGTLIIGGTTYIFALLCVVVYEIDDPCHGFWVIKSIPDDWLKQDPKKWRATRFKFDKIEVTVSDSEVAVKATTSED